MHPFAWHYVRFVCFIPFLFAPTFFPAVKLSYLTPYLILILYQKSLKNQFLQALLVGFILDLFATSTPFGYMGLITITSLWLLNFLKSFFFEDKFLTLPLMTFFYSITSTLVTFTLCHFFIKKLSITKAWIFTDLIIYPFFDAFYALFVIALPLKFLNQILPKKRRVVRSLRLND